MDITINENNLRVSFRVNDDRTVEFIDFSAFSESKVLELHESKTIAVENQAFQLLALQITGDSTTDMHAHKHNAGSASSKLLYKGHHISTNTAGKLLEIDMQLNQLEAGYFMHFYADIPVVRTWATIKNTGTEDVGIDYISSFMYEGLCKNGNKKYYEKTDIFVPYNSWSNEAQWRVYDATDVGLSRMPIAGYNNPDFGNNRYHYGNCGSWSSCEYLPIGIIKDRETDEIYFFQIEHSGSWEIEYGSAKGRNLYVALIGPNDESAWWKNLKPGESFTTVPAAAGVCLGNESDAIACLTRYRRVIRRKNNDNKNCYIIFNDYMNCLMGNPTEEKEKKIIDKAAEMGCEYYCMDCGWYDKGSWWNRVGEWKESSDRFPTGMKSVCDYALSKGLKMGLWLEIEVIGTACELAKKLPDSWFFCLHGKRRIDNKRYLLDFRNREVREYCRNVVDRLIRDYGVSYFKIDYNVTTGPGSDINSDSPGDAMLEHYRCLYQWYHDIYTAYPDLVIENCGSGAQRMDYGMLALDSLQSTSDQTDYIANSYIASNVASALTPEQAGMWVYPYIDDREHIIYNMVNGILLRPYMSGLVWNISNTNFNMIKEGLEVYKKVRVDLPEMVPFFPLGFTTVKSDVLAYGVMNSSKAYLAVFIPQKNHAQFKLHIGNKEIKQIRVIYPRAVDCRYSYEDEILKIEIPQKVCARLFELIFV